MARKSNRKNSGFPASSVTRPGSKAISQALKQRRYIDIQLKDVLEEMARGNWTEEDDRLWKTTKPYECDKCSERSSTRYNNNRHKLNKHSVKKITRCPFPGCKLAFSRSDNLVKHQKKHHPEADCIYPTDGVGDSPEIQELIAKFRRILPSADDLPKNPEPGFGLERYYAYGVLPFLPPELLSHYTDYYFSSNAFHPLFPLLHKATFKPSSVLASFLRAVCALGGQYDPTNKTLSSQLWESGVKVMERWIERGPVETDDMDAEKLKKPTSEESATAKKKPRRNSQYVIPEGIVRPSEPISDYQATPPERQVSKDRYAEKREREGGLCVLQGLLLFSVYALFSDDKEKHNKGRRLLVRSLEIARDYGYFREEEERRIYPDTSVQHQWEHFVYKESRKRVAFTLFLFDCYMALVFDTPRLIRSTELRNLPLPCDAQLFGAQTSHAWHRLWQTSHLHGSANLPSPLFGRTLRTLLQGDGHTDLLQVGGLGSNFSALILAAAIQMEVMDFTRKLAEEYVEHDDDGKPELDRTSDIAIMPDLFAEESYRELGKLRQALDTLRQVSGIGNMFVNPGHEVGTNVPIGGLASDPNANPAILQPSRLKGCERAFYLSIHLALIQLVIPDRVVICLKDVPVDLDTALCNIVDSAKERVSTANPSARESFMRILDGSDLLSHLLSLLKFLAGPHSAYQESARSTEFPVLTVMIFKALMVVWEVLFRIGEIDNSSVGNTTAENIAMYPWGFDTPQGSEDWMLMVDDEMVNWDDLLLQTSQESARQLSPVDRFRHELSSLLWNWELRNDQDQDGLESLEWRFLEWMKSVFTDMKHWNVGLAVVNALNRLFEDDEEDAGSEAYEDA